MIARSRWRGLWVFESDWWCPEISILGGFQAISTAMVVRDLSLAYGYHEEELVSIAERLRTAVNNIDLNGQSITLKWKSKIHTYR